MKKLTALITTAILGLSSAAIAKPAAPTQVADAQHDRDRFDDHGRYDHDRYDRDHYRRDSRWLDLGVAHSGRTVLRLDGRTKFRSLRLDVDGWLRVNQVLVRFGDGSERMIKLHRASVSNRDPLVVDLGASRRITSVVVYASRYGRGSVQISGLKAQPIYRDRG